MAQAYTIIVGEVVRTEYTKYFLHEFQLIMGRKIFFPSCLYLIRNTEIIIFKCNCSLKYMKCKNCICTVIVVVLEIDNFPQPW